MKADHFACALLVLLSAAFHLPAQQPTTNAAGTNETFRDSFFEETKAEAEKGNASAENRLGAMYEGGIGVIKDSMEAGKWYRKAAEQGNPNYQYDVGYYYERGKAYVEAAKWYQRAANQGNLIAQQSLGDFYHDGNGVPKSSVEAYKWYNLAASQSAKNESEKKFIEYSASARDLMVKTENISSEEIAEAQRLSNDFVPERKCPVQTILLYLSIPPPPARAFSSRTMVI